MEIRKIGLFGSQRDSLFDSAYAGLRRCDAEPLRNDLSLFRPNDPVRGTDGVVVVGNSQNAIACADFYRGLGQSTLRVSAPLIPSPTVPCFLVADFEGEIPPDIEGDPNRVHDLDRALYDLGLDPTISKPRKRVKAQGILVLGEDYDDSNRYLAWANQFVKDLRRVTTSKIIWWTRPGKPHAPEGVDEVVTSLEDAMSRAYVVAGHSASDEALAAVRAGLPVILESPGFLGPITNSINEFAQLSVPTEEEFLAFLAWVASHQWTQAEIESGLPFVLPERPGTPEQPLPPPPGIPVPPPGGGKPPGEGEGETPEKPEEPEEPEEPPKEPEGPSVEPPIEDGEPEEPKEPATTDDLTTIRGIGAAMANKLNAAGIENFDQLREVSPEDLAAAGLTPMAIKAVTAWQG